MIEHISGSLARAVRETEMAFKRKRAGLSIKPKKPLLGAKSGSITNKSAHDRIKKQLAYDERKDNNKKLKKEREKVALKNFKTRQRANNDSRNKAKEKRQAYSRNDIEKTRRNYSNHDKVRNLRGGWGRKPA